MARKPLVATWGEKNQDCFSLVRSPRRCAPWFCSWWCQSSRACASDLSPVVWDSIVNQPSILCLMGRKEIKGKRQQQPSLFSFSRNGGAFAHHFSLDPGPRLCLLGQSRVLRQSSRALGGWTMGGISDCRAWQWFSFDWLFHYLP